MLAGDSTAWGQAMVLLRKWLFVVLALALPAAAHAGTRVALVVGNGTYAAAGQLANPLSDARLVGHALRQTGFEVVPMNNATVAQMRAALSSFRQKAQGAEVALVYFAGHGIEANGRNWLLPVDARLASDYDLGFEAIDLDQVLGALTGAQKRIVVLDACRNNPFGQAWKAGSRAVTRGLGRVEVDDVLVMFAAAPGSTASDGTGGNSPFARSLVQRLVQPGLMLQVLPGKVRDDVVAATGGEQKPFVSASISGEEYYLVPGSAPARPPTTLQAPQAPAYVASVPRPQTSVDATMLNAECERLTSVESTSVLPVLAIPACTRAVEVLPGNAAMKMRLGFAYNANKDYAQARNWFEQAAADGNSSAMTNLGVLYRDGNGVVADFLQARAWFEQAYAKGSVLAMRNLGFLYANGQGVPQDFAQARRWFEQAAAQGNAEATGQLGIYYQFGKGVTQDYLQARRWYEQAVAKGDGDAMNNLGTLYRDGIGTGQDYVQARRLFEQAHAKGSVLAMRNLGFLYANGQGVPQDFAEARRWFEQAAAKGNAEAMGQLGIHYQFGKGVTRDYLQARRWYEQAVAKGDGDAMNNLGTLYRDGTGTGQDYVQARRLFEQAYAKGSVLAMRNLGFLYASGQGVPRDFAEARRWFEQAAAKGNEDARKWLRENPQ